MGRIDQPTTPPPPDYDEIAQMLERRIVEPEVPDSNPPSGKFFCAMQQRVTSGPYQTDVRPNINVHGMVIKHCLTIVNDFYWEQVQHRHWS